MKLAPSLAMTLVAISLYARTTAAQTTAAPPSDANPAAIDPVLMRPAASLTPADVAKLQTLVSDYAQLARYRAANASLQSAAGRVVFFGDSITDAWGNGANAATFFPGKPYLDRGIGGQTTSQMLLRFQQDVVALHPVAVVILAGTNDIAGNTGVSSIAMIEDNMTSMANIADANGIKLILSSVLPVDDYVWRRGLQPSPRVRALNTWMQAMCSRRGYTYLDYYTALATPDGAMKPGTSKDGVHPTVQGYAIMAPLAQAAIDRTLAADGETSRR